MVPYISVTRLSPRTKKSWRALFRRALAAANKSDYDPWFFQKDSLGTWESYNYQHFLVQVRMKNRGLLVSDPFPQNKAWQWRLRHRLDLWKRGIYKPCGFVENYGSMTGNSLKLRMTHLGKTE